MAFLVFRLRLIGADAIVVYAPEKIRIFTDSGREIGNNKTLKIDQFYAYLPYIIAADNNIGNRATETDIFIFCSLLFVRLQTAATCVCLCVCVYEVPLL